MDGGDDGDSPRTDGTTVRVSRRSDGNGLTRRTYGIFGLVERDSNGRRLEPLDSRLEDQFRVGSGRF